MFGQILLVSFIGGIVSLDVMTVWQIMISRPLVTAPIIGWLCGDMWVGLIIGIILELIWINILPLGAIIPPDVSATAIMATAQAIIAKQLLPYQNSDVIIMLAVMCAVPLGGLFKRVDIGLRWFNRNFAHWIDKYADEGNITGIELVTRLSIVTVFVKTFIFYVIGIWLGVRLISGITPLLPLSVKEGLRLSRTLLPALGFAAVLDIFGTKK